ncbi:MAG: sulfatase-like hydrolase/transferase [Opitutales bacterium]|nr:sulfatase-like hydrolase/transferase [Opitutales bacterium]
MASKDPAKPNILFLISDDTATQYLGCYGAAMLTPNLDAIAADGVRFTDAHVATPVCTPSRYTYQTGKYAHRGITPGGKESDPSDAIVQVGFNAKIKPGDPCLPTILKENGYKTGFVGKVHFGRGLGQLGCEPWPGDGDPHRPEVDAVMKKNQRLFVDEMHRIGWDEAESLTWGNIDCTKQRKAWNHNQEWLTSGALNILDKFEGDEQPFYLTMATNVIHGPDHGRSILDLDPKATYAGMLDEAPEVQPSRQSIIDRLEAEGLPVSHRTVGMLWIDDAFGALVEKLKEMGIYDNTIIIYSADHGVEGKWSCHSNGTHVPQLWKLPSQHNAGHRSHVLVQNIDFAPTLLDLVGITPPDDYLMDGTSIRSALEGSQEQVHNELYFEFGSQRGIRTPKWKYLIVRYGEDDLKAMKTGMSPAINVHGGKSVSRCQLTHPHFWDPDQIYDFYTDPDEHMNLIDWPENTDVVADMKARLKRYTERFNPAYPDEADPYQNSPMYRSLTQAVVRTGLSDIQENFPFYVEGSY